MKLFDFIMCINSRKNIPQQFFQIQLSPYERGDLLLATSIWWNKSTPKQHRKGDFYDHHFNKSPSIPIVLSLSI